MARDMSLKHFKKSQRKESKNKVCSVVHLESRALLLYGGLESVWSDVKLVEHE